MPRGREHLGSAVAVEVGVVALARRQVEHGRHQRAAAVQEHRDSDLAGHEHVGATVAVEVADDGEVRDTRAVTAAPGAVAPPWHAARRTTRERRDLRYGPSGMPAPAPRVQSSYLV